MSMAASRINGSESQRTPSMSKMTAAMAGVAAESSMAGNITTTTDGLKPDWAST
jgi:hypothetical protein